MVIFSDKQAKELNKILSYALSKGYKANDLDDYVSIAEKINSKKENDEFDDTNDSKIFVVTSGSYSDYIIEKIFSNEKAAYDYSDIYNKSSNKYSDSIVEEYDFLEKSVLKEVKYIKASYTVKFIKEKGKDKDQKKADKLNSMINGRGATDGEKENAKRLLDKLKKKKSLDKIIEKPNYEFNIITSDNERYPNPSDIVNSNYTSHKGTNKPVFSLLGIHLYNDDEDIDYSYNKIIIERPIYQKNYDEDKLKAKYKQVCLDLYYQIKYLQEHDHLTEDQINDLLKNKSVASKVEE